MNSLQAQLAREGHAASLFELWRWLTSAQYVLDDQAASAGGDVLICGRVKLRMDLFSTYGTGHLASVLNESLKPEQRICK